MYQTLIRFSCISLFSLALIQTSQAQLVGSWDFDEGSGTTFAGNLSGLDGTLSADAFSSDSPTGASGDFSLEFTGTETAVVQDPDGLLQADASLAFTVEAYIKVTEVPGSRIIIASYGLPGGYSFSFTPDRQLFTTTYGIADISSETAIVPDDGGWHHVAVAFDFDNQAMLFYIDGELSATTAYAGVVNPTDFTRLYIGAEVASDTTDLINPFVGLIDRLRIHNVVVAPEDFDLVEVAPTSNVDHWMFLK